LAPLTRSADAAIQPGTEYRLVKSPQRQESTGQVEILEFFAYTCPHCYRLETVVGPWAKKLPAEIALRRLPVVFAESTVPLAKAYFTLEAMGAIEPLHLRMFQALQEQQVWLMQEKTLFAWIARQGIDAKRFAEIYRSFAIHGQTSRARQLAQTFEIDAVPTLVVGGKYQTSASLAGSAAALPKVLDDLVTLIRQENRGRG
jgi:thiol:disulfide interchange protein DsbA